jgi:hypothetical protein
MEVAMRKPVRYMLFSCLAAAACVISLTGCGSKKVTTQSLLKKAEAKESENVSMDIESDMTLSLEDMAMNFHYTRTIDAKSTVQMDGVNIYAQIAMANVETLDGDTHDVTQNTKMYIVPNGAKERVYISVDESGWMFYEQDHEDVSYYSLPEIYKSDVQWTLAESTEVIDGQEAYVLTASLPVNDEMLQGSLNDFSDAMMDVIRTIDIGSMRVDAKVWISADADGGLLRAEYDWNDSFSAERFIGTDLEGFSATLKEVYTNISYGNVKIEVPEYVISSAEVADLAEDYDIAIAEDEETETAQEGQTAEGESIQEGQAAEGETVQEGQTAEGETVQEGQAAVE